MKKGLAIMLSLTLCFLCTASLAEDGIEDFDETEWIAIAEDGEQLSETIDLEISLEDAEELTEEDAETLAEVDTELLAEEVVEELTEEDEEEASLDELTDEPDNADVENLIDDAADDLESEAADGDAIAEIERSVSLAYSFDNVLDEGEGVTITAVLKGFDGVEVSFQWQFEGDSGWIDVTGANQRSFTIFAGEKALGNRYRVCVCIAEDGL